MDTPKRILVVEDEEPILRILQHYLESVGFDVHGETRGTQAVHYASTHKPDLVILDLRLPDAHGFQVCERLRTLYQSWVVPIMMLTAMDSSQDRANGLAAGADAYLTKPFELPALLPVIEGLLGKIDPSIPPPPPDATFECPPDEFLDEGKRP